MVNLVAQCVRHFYNSLLKKSVSTNNNRMSAAPCAATAQTNHEAAQLYAPLCSPKVIRPIKWRMGCVGERRGAYRVLVCKPEGRSPLGRPRHRCEDNITMYLQEMGCVCGRGEVHTGFWSANLREGVHLEDRGIDARIILQCIFRKSVGRA